MRLASRFWSRLLLWAGILMGILVGIALVTGAGLTPTVAQLPTWAGLAVALAAFPAGITVAGDVIPTDRLQWRPWLAFAVVATSASLVLFGLANFVGPAAGRLLDGPGAVATEVDPSRLALPALRAEAREALSRARTDGDAELLERWRPANRLIWHWVRRTDGSALPFLFGLIGVLTGYWSARAPRRELRQAQQWGIGVFLLVSTYLASENSYELIVLRAAGPVPFAADLVLVVPALLTLGIGWPTLVTLVWAAGERSPW